jgi:CRP-like cAMP-binding protein
MAMEDDFATAYYSFISGKQSYETIACLEPTKVSAIHFDRLQELYKMFPETEKAGRLILEEYYLKMESRFYAIRFTSAEQRYRTFAEDRSQLLNRAPLGWIASYLGMTQETLSRIRARRETAL